MARFSKWKLSDHQATWNRNGVQLQVSVNHPGNGCSVGSDVRLLGVVAEADPVEPIETFCRGEDLVLRYIASQVASLDQEIYWRPLSGQEALAVEDDDSILLALETIYSLQTDSLDLHPQPAAVSAFDAASVSWFRCASATGGNVDSQWEPLADVGDVGVASKDCYAIAAIVRLQSGTTVLQTALPADLRGVEVETTEGQTRLNWQLRSDFLEKGVIRRLRMCSLIATADAEDASLLDAASQFYGSELPLTV